MPHNVSNKMMSQTRWSRACVRDGASPGRHVRALAKRPKELIEKKEETQPTLNPVELGRRSRQAIEDAWANVTRISTPRASFALDDDLGAGLASDLESPEAQFTRVLVVGGTGRVGRIVVRKLLLRGYNVRVMCRDLRDEAASLLPSSVEILRGDVGDLDACQRAVNGMDKIIYCATSTVQLTGDIDKVDNVGVSHISRTWIHAKHASAGKAKTETKAVKRMIANFSKEKAQDEWDLMHVGPLVKEIGYGGQDFANALIAEDQSRLCFQGSIYSRSGICEWGGPSGDLSDCESLIARILSDGKPYLCILQDSEGHSYKQRFSTRLGFVTALLPFNRFRAEDRASPPLRPGMITTIKFRFDKSQLPAEKPMVSSAEEAEERNARNSFNFEVAYIKAQPVRTEPTVILVSCAGAAGTDASDDTAEAERGAFAGPEANVLGAIEGVNARRVTLKRRGEAGLRSSGVGYCIVRPSKLLQEPGGYKALVFDQGDRIQQGIGYADVADVCLRALHAPEAVNKTFEVCYETTTAEGEALEYELVAHMPDRSTNILKQALVSLERNT